jgi:LPXTG-motif cell wall-anchored protein
MKEYANYLQAAGAFAILVALLTWVKKRKKK